jgi:acyl-coenzyme A thioesterase PaaI-like protein
MDYSQSVPPGFERLDLGAGFALQFGPIYLNRPAQRLGFRVVSHHLNPVATCHGGVLATFADMQIAAVRPPSDISSKHWPTVSLSLDYLAPVRLHSWLEAAVTCVKTTQTLVFTQALLTVEGEPVARTAAIYRNRQ